jgi:hypothetical protein
MLANRSEICNANSETGHLDRRLIALNLLFLACVAFLPYATAVLGTWGNTSPGVAFYAAATAAVGLAQGAIWFHAARGDRLTVPGVSASLCSAWMLNLLQTPIVFLVPIPVAFVSPVIDVCLWALSLLVRRVLRRRVQAALDELDTATTRSRARPSREALLPAVCPDGIVASRSAATQTLSAASRWYQPVAPTVLVGLLVRLAGMGGVR